MRLLLSELIPAINLNYANPLRGFLTLAFQVFNIQLIIIKFMNINKILGLSACLGSLVLSNQSFAQTELDQSNWSSSSNRNTENSLFAIDGNADTRWTTRQTQRDGQYFEVNFNSTNTFNRVVLDTSASENDYPREYELQVSNDGSRWTTVASATPDASGITTIDFSNQTASHIRIEQHGADRRYWWSIHEMSIFSEEDSNSVPELTALDRTNWSLTSNRNDADSFFAIDSDTNTRWTTGQTQRDGQYFEVNFNSINTFNRVVLDTSASENDYPREYELQVSDNGSSWTTVASAAPDASGITTIDFSNQTASHIRIEQHGADRRYWWSIHEMNIFADVDSTPAPTPEPIPMPTPVSSGIENVLLIVADDMGVDNVSAYAEHTQSAFTPTIDQLASQGVLFRNAWANPSCAPTRGSLMTGRYAFRNGATHPNAGQNVLDTEEVTIAEVISDAGYETALFGKWHLGNGRGGNPGTLPTDQGFDYFSGHINGNIVDYFGWPKTTLTAPGQTQAANEITETGYATEVNTQEAVSWINATTNPWLAIVSYAAPHSPFHVPPEERYSNVDLNGNVGTICDGGNGGRGNGGNGGGNAANSDDDCYRAMAEVMDSYISDLLTQIDAEKLANTLIVIMGDNGTPTQTTIDEGIFSTSHAKGSVFQGGVRVPLIMAGGSNVNLVNAEIANLTDVTDLFSTIIDIAGAEQPNNVQIDGQSLLGYVTPAVPTPTPREFQFAESIDGDTDQWAISDGTTKFIFDTDVGNRGTGGCYNLITDPGELNSNSGDQAVCDALQSSSPRNQ